MGWKPVLCKQNSDWLYMRWTIVPIDLVSVQTSDNHQLVQIIQAIKCEIWSTAFAVLALILITSSCGYASFCASIGETGVGFAHYSPPIIILSLILYADVSYCAE